MRKPFLYILLTLSILVFLISLFQKLHYSPDDTFIYLQYARNIASGNGFSFNPGEPSYGVTSPLWVIILSIPYLFKADGFWFSKVFDLVCALLSAAAFYKLSFFFFKENRVLRYTAGAVFLMNPWFIRWAFTGMETSLAVLLVILVFYCYYSGRKHIMFFLLGVFYLVRPESFVLSAVLFSLVIFHGYRSKNLKFSDVILYILLLSAAVIPFLIYSGFNFGTILPNTALGKSTFTLSSTVFFNQLREIIKTLAGSSIIEMILSAAFIVISFRKRSVQNTLPLLLWIASLTALYILTDADIISRYLLIISPFLILTGLKALDGANGMEVKAAAVFFVCLLYSQFIFYEFVKPSTDDFTRGVNECFIPIGNWLSESTSQGSRVLLNDVGAVGYYSHRYIIDAAALINRDLNLNREIMKTPVEERMHTYNLLKLVDADYIVERDSSDMQTREYADNPKLELKFMKKFPSLGIRDISPKYYKVYKIIK